MAFGGFQLLIRAAEATTVHGQERLSRPGQKLRLLYVKDGPLEWRGAHDDICVWRRNRL